MALPASGQEAKILCTMVKDVSLEAVEVLRAIAKMERAFPLQHLP
jgi:hypothetical protein